MSRRRGVLVRSSGCQVSGAGVGGYPNFAGSNQDTRPGAGYPSLLGMLRLAGCGQHEYTATTHKKITDHSE
eukprot:scaffold662530_cov64-Prasinocladus_malaysianus.AAC.1